MGFRFTTRDLAGGFEVGGYVRNLRDGTVEVVAQGHRSVVERFVQTLEERLVVYIRGSERTWGEEAEEFDSFEIRF